jgi:hypothetical protein
MRTGKVLIAGLMLVLASAGCGARGDDGDGVATAQSGAATAEPTPSKTLDEDAPLKFAQCMREQGLTWFPDPDPNGRTIVKTPKGTDPEKMQAAHEACQKFAPDGGDPGEVDPEMLEQGRKLARCMRENGVPDFPDPQPDGGIRLERKKDGSGIGPGDPAFDKAEQKCSQFMPDGREKATA